MSQCYLGCNSWFVLFKFRYNPGSSSTIVSEPELIVMHNLVVHGPKSNFLLLLSSKMNATF